MWPPICKNGALPTELIWQRIAGDGLEPTTPGVWTLWAIQLLYPAVPDARIELTASWSQTRRSTKLSQSGICSRTSATVLQVTGLQEKRMLSSYAVTLSVKRPHRDLNPESPDRQSGGITNYPMRPYYFGLLLKYAPQIHTRVLFAPRSKPSWQGETRTHDVSLWLIYSQLPSPLGYLPVQINQFLFFSLLLLNLLF